MNKMLLIIVFLLKIIPGISQPASDEAAIRATLFNYIEGRNNGDTARLAKSFHPRADLRYRNQQTDTMTIWTAPDYVKSFVPGRKLNCTGEIISITITGSAAQAKVALYYPDRTYADYFNLLKVGNEWVIASKIFSLYPVQKKVLFIITSHEQLGSTGKKTGFHFGELAQAYKPFHEAGFRVDIASPRGGKTNMYGFNLNDSVELGFFQNHDAVRNLSNAIALSRIRAEEYVAVYFVGGHGAMWDLPNDTNVSRITRSIYENNGVVGAVCHGPAALINTTLSNGAFLVAGKKLAAFTNSEETETNLHKVVPFLLESELAKRRATMINVPNWQYNVQVDGRLVTGQNPSSANGVAQQMVKLLHQPASK